MPNTNTNQDVILKDDTGVYIYPLSRRDTDGEIIQEKYLIKASNNSANVDSYLYEATVTDDVFPGTQIAVKKLTLKNKKSTIPDVVLYAGTAGVSWGSITGSITAQSDLNNTFAKQTDIQTAITNHNDDANAHQSTIQTAITNHNNDANAHTGLKLYHVGSSAPSNTNLLWVDTTSVTGGLKYYNNGSWTTVPVAYSR